jgi:CheY-like chemotaxis protein
MTNPLALIIEDDEYQADIFSLALQAAEFESEVVNDGAVALTRLAAITPDLVILDLHLPSFSGRDILHQIRADKRLTETRVILATADAVMADLLRDESDLVLLKPISATQLRDLAIRLRPLDLMG